jgi:hypothetical protein
VKRHPAIRKLAERNPRLHGVILLLFAGIFAYFGWRAASAIMGVIFFTMALFIGAVGTGYAVFGSACATMETRWEDSFDPNNVSWRQAIALAAFGFGTLALALGLYRLAR